MKILYKYKNIIVRIFTLSCFLVSFIFAQTAFCLIPSNNGVKQTDSLFKSMPVCPGKIVDGMNFGTDEIIVNIQDLHCHSEVQKNISRILKTLDQNYALQNIFVEGAYGKVDTSWLCRIKNNKKDIIESLIDDGMLSGAECYSALANKPYLLQGIEDEKIYKNNINRLGKIINNKDHFENIVKKLKVSLHLMQAKYLNKKSKRFNSIVEEYRNGSIKWEKYYKLLEKYANKSEIYGFTISKEKYLNIKKYNNLIELRGRLRYRKIEIQIYDFIKNLKKQIPYKVYAIIHKQTENFTNSEEVYASLNKIIKDYKISTNGYEDLKNFLDYVENKRSINLKQLINEKQEYAAEIRGGLCKDICELEISFLSDFFIYFEEYLLNKLSADDYDYFEANFGKFKALWNKYAIKNRIDGLSEDFSLLNTYYEINCQRNKIFIENILGRELLEGKSFAGKTKEKISGNQNIIEALNKYKKITVVITGGFHSEGIKNILESKKVSYLIVSPNIAEPSEKAKKIYTDLALKQAEISGSALALSLASQMSSERMFSVLLNAAIKNIGEADFNHENIERLVNEINDYTKAGAVVEFEHDTAKIIFTNSTYVILNNNDGKIGINKEKSFISKRIYDIREYLSKNLMEVFYSSVCEVKQLIYMVENGLNIAEILIDSNTFIELLEILSKTELFSNNGLIYEIANDQEFLDHLTETQQDVLGDFSNTIQQSVYKAYIEEKNAKTELLNSNTKLLRLVLTTEVALNWVLSVKNSGVAEYLISEDNDFKHLFSLITTKYLKIINWDDFNFQILNFMAFNIYNDFKNFQDVENEYYNKYVEYIIQLVNVLHSQAWLSKTSELSSGHERGVLQGEKYIYGYEREVLYSATPEKLLLKYFLNNNSISLSKQQSIIFRNERILLNDLMNSLITSYRQRDFYVSSNFSDTIQQTIKVFFNEDNNIETPSYKVGFVFASDINSSNFSDTIQETIKVFFNEDNNIETPSYKVGFVCESDINSPNFLSFVDSQNIEHIFIYTNDINFKISKELINKANEKLINLYVIYFNDINFAQIPRTYMPYAVLMQVSASSENSRHIFSSLKFIIEKGGNINSYSAWEIELLYGINEIEDEFFDKRKKSTDFYNVMGDQLIISRVPEYKEKYNKLLKKLLKIQLQTDIYKIVKNTIEEHQKTLNDSEQVFDIQKYRDAISEFRTLLKHTIYLQWLSVEQAGKRESEYKELESKFEGYFNTFSNLSGNKNFYTSSMLCSSGMSTLKTIVNYLLKYGHDKNQPCKIVLGQNLYCETREFFDKDLKQNCIVKKVNETIYRNILIRIYSNESNALIIDPISNSVKDEDCQDMPVADFNQLINEFIKTKHEKPFYLIIDTSILGLQFQISDYIKEKTIPKNLHFILYTSLQKLYEEGLETTTGGAITIISGDKESNNQVYNSLKNIRLLSGTEPTLFNYICLDSLPMYSDENFIKNMLSRANKILKNSQELAEYFEPQIKAVGGEVIHPGLPSHKDHNIWLQNNKMGIPFFMFRLNNHQVNLKFLKIFSDELLIRGLPVQNRDSYGFSNLSYTIYLVLDEAKEPVRISVPPYNKEEIALVKKAFDATMFKIKQIAIYERQKEKKREETMMEMLKESVNILRDKFAPAVDLIIKSSFDSKLKNPKMFAGRKTIYHISNFNSRKANFKKFINTVDLNHIWFIDKHSGLTNYIYPLGFKVNVSGEENSIDVWISINSSRLIFWFDFEKAGIRKDNVDRALRECSVQVIQHIRGTDSVNASEDSSQYLTSLLHNKNIGSDEYAKPGLSMVIDHTGSPEEVKQILSEADINTVPIISYEDIEKRLETSMNQSINQELIKHKAYSQMFANNKIIKIDAENIDDFANKLNMFNNASNNSQMLVDWEIFEKGIIDKKINNTKIFELVKNANMNGIQIFVNIKEAGLDKIDNILKLGFAGFTLDLTNISQEKINSLTFLQKYKHKILAVKADSEVKLPEGIQKIQVYELGAIGAQISSDEVMDIRISEELSKETIRNKMKFLPLQNTMIFHLSDASKLIESTRDIIDKKGFESILKILINFGDKRITTENSARQLGYRWSLEELVKNKEQTDIAEIVKNNPAVMNQLHDLQTEKLQKAFLEALIEKMLIKDKIFNQNTDMYNKYIKGELIFNSCEHEQMLGRVLYYNYSRSVQYEANENIEVEYQNLNILYNEILAGRADYAVPAVIDFLFNELYSEYNLKKAFKDKPKSFNSRSVMQLLSAA